MTSLITEITENTTIRQTDLANYDWSNGGVELKGKITVTFGSDLTSDDTDNIHFIVEDNSGNEVTIDGANHIVDVTATAGYGGLVNRRRTKP